MPKHLREIISISELWKVVEPFIPNFAYMGAIINWKMSKDQPLKIRLLSE